MGGLDDGLREERLLLTKMSSLPYQSYIWKASFFVLFLGLGRCTLPSSNSHQRHQISLAFLSVVSFRLALND